MDATKQHANSISGKSLRRLGNALVLILALGTAVTLPAQSADEPAVATYHLLYSFSSSHGCAPSAGPLVQDASGNLYGTTNGGGQFSKGTVFKVTPSGTETVLHSFYGPPSDGWYPGYASLTLDATGDVYGTTPNGGEPGYGVVFKVTATGTESILYNFTGGTDGGNPFGGLVRDSEGNLYGTTEDGGTFGVGVVFKLTPSLTESVLHNFKYSLKDGAVPVSNLTQDSLGNLYGTTEDGGAFNGGTVFKVTPSGSETLLHSFKGYPVDGADPVGDGLLRDTSGNLYGVTFGGGKSGDGVVFKLTTTLTESVLFNFNGSNSGGSPFASGELAEDTSGNLYGTTNAGGSGVGCPFAGCGVLFELSAGKQIVLHNFNFSSTTDGAYPGGVLRDSSGNLYGVLTAGGAHGCGAVFKYTP